MQQESFHRLLHSLSNLKTINFCAQDGNSSTLRSKMGRNRSVISIIVDVDHFLFPHSALPRFNISFSFFHNFVFLFWSWVFYFNQWAQFAWSRSLLSTCSERRTNDMLILTEHYKKHDVIQVKGNIFVQTSIPIYFEYNQKYWDNVIFHKLKVDSDHLKSIRNYRKKKFFRLREPCFSQSGVPTRRLKLRIQIFF